MDKTFQKLLQTDIDLSSLGVERRTDNEPLFLHTKGCICIWLDRCGWNPLLFCSWLWRYGFCCQPGEHISKLCSSVGKKFR